MKKGTGKKYLLTALIPVLIVIGGGLNYIGIFDPIYSMFENTDDLNETEEVVEASEKSDLYKKSSNNESSSTKKSKDHPLASKIGDIKTIKGEIIKYSPTDDGHIFITLKSSEGYEILLPLFNNLSPEKLSLSEGEEIEVTGKIDKYDGEIEILINSTSDIQVLTEKTSNDSYIKIQSIDTSNIGENVEIKGSLDDLFISDKGTVFFELSDDTGTIDLVLFTGSSSYDQIRKVIEREAYSSEEKVVISGEVNEYQGNLQIIINKVKVE